MIDTPLAATIVDIRATMPQPTQNNLRLAEGKKIDKSNAREVKLPFLSLLGKGPGDGV